MSELAQIPDRVFAYDLGFDELGKPSRNDRAIRSRLSNWLASASPGGMQQTEADSICLKHRLCGSGKLIGDCPIGPTLNAAAPEKMDR